MKRPSSTQRGYDRRWQKLRAAKLDADPMCQLQTLCEGDPATEVDHSDRISQGGDRLDWDNLQSACKRCHSAKTMSEVRGRGGNKMTSRPRRAGAYFFAIK